ncbi:MAG: hypothetical protein R2710_17575 [Acidimicrobiales bacterium]
MAGNGDPKSPLDQLVDLFVYAPVGFLYERDEVVDRLITRGKSQVQLARLMAKMASQQPGGTEAMVNEAVGFAADVVAKSLAEFGAALGLVPTPARAGERDDVVDVEEHPSPDPVGDADADDVSTADAESVALPIDDYDALNARAVVAALDDLTLDQVEVIAAYERSHRNRKTILAKVDRMGA